jgi:hypothetical protein
VALPFVSFLVETEIARVAELLAIDYPVVAAF